MHHEEPTEIYEELLIFGAWRAVELLGTRSISDPFTALLIRWNNLIIEFTNADLRSLNVGR